MSACAVAVQTALVASSRRTPGSSRATHLHRYWVPACAGMTPVLAKAPSRACIEGRP